MFRIATEVLVDSLGVLSFKLGKRMYYYNFSFSAIKVTAAGTVIDCTILQLIKTESVE